jgi:hypothetical protein
MYRLPPSAGAPEFRALLEYWMSKRPAGAAPGWLPGRQHVDPAELPPRQLQQVLLFEVVPPSGSMAARRFRFRVAGTAFAQLVGRDVTGLHVDELGAPDRVAPVDRALNMVVDARRPVFLEGRLTLPSAEFCWVRRLGVPLAQDGVQVDMVLSVWLAERRPLAETSQRPLPEPDGAGPQPLEAA